MLAGSVLMALGLVALGRVESIPQLIGVYLVLASGFAMTGPVPSSALITRWFEGRRARAMSIAQTGVSAGGIVLVPVMTRLIESGGLAAATDRLALALVAVVVPLTCFVLRSDPRRHGLEPDGVAATSRMDPEDAVARGPVWTLPATLRSRTFWQLVLAFGGILFCQVGAGMHQLSRLRVDLEPETAALAVSTTAFGSLVARLVVGGFADRVDQRRLGSALIGVQALALFGFSQVSAVGSLFAVSLCFGFTIGNLFMLQALIVGRLFGVVSFASVLGLLQLITQMTSGIGPFALGLLHDRFGGYPEGYAILAGVALVSGIALLGVRAPRPPSR
jgi:MFS family permease